MPLDPSDRSAIRRHMRAQRNQLSPQQQLKHAKQLSQNLMSQTWFQRAQVIASYLANDGEIDPVVVSERALYRKRQLYLPSLHPLKKGQLLFGPYHGPKINNRFGISEPDPKRNNMLEAKQLDLVLLPLVAFDHQGGRLGMGGGFYDRTFEFLLKGGLAKPKLIGLAHDLQQVDKLPVESWDVPLAAIVTPTQVIQAGH